MKRELDDVIYKVNIIWRVRSRRIVWIGHMMRMDNYIIPNKNMPWKREERNLRGILWKTQMGDIEEGKKIMEIPG